MDIHNYKKRYERELERFGELSLCEKDRKAVRKFNDHCICENISYGKLSAYLFYLRKFIVMLKKPMESADKEDLMRVVSELNQMSYSEETKSSFKIMIRKLYKILRGVEGKGEYPPEVKWISIGIRNNHKKLPEELLTEKEIENIIKHTECLRDKALISTWYESGARVGEIGTMQIKHVSFEEYGAKITVRGKTGMRKSLLVNSTPYLQSWINEHPQNEDKDSYLWISTQGAPIKYARMANILKLAAKRAGINKRVHPHLLRHSRATELASFMTESSMKHFLGWTQGSKMAGIYIHMSGKETDETILRHHGVIKDEKKEKPRLEPLNCLRCKTKNEATNQCCKHCGLILNKEYAKDKIREDLERQRSDDAMNRLVRDPEFIDLIRKKFPSFFS